MLSIWTTLSHSHFIKSSDRIIIYLDYRQLDDSTQCDFHVSEVNDQYGTAPGLCLSFPPCMVSSRWASLSLPHVYQEGVLPFLNGARVQLRICLKICIPKSKKKKTPFHFQLTLNIQQKKL